MLPPWVQAGLWGGAAGAALLAGAGAGYALRLPQRLVAAVMALGSGLLIAALSFELMEQAYVNGGFAVASTGLFFGAGAFTIFNWFLAQQGARHRKRSGRHQPSEHEIGGSGIAIAIGALLDSIPESLVIGVGLIDNGVSLAVISAVVLTNFAEGLSSASGMRKADRPARYVFTVWGAIGAACVLSAAAGYSLFQHLSPNGIGAANAIAGGAILAMLVDTMIPEAFEETHEYAGLITVCGFLAGFMLTKTL